MKTDLRQLRHRLYLSQLSDHVDTDAQELFQSVDQELQTPFRLKADSSLVINVGPAMIDNASHNNHRIPFPFGGVYSAFVGGTITLPNTGTGNIAPSVGNLVPLELTASRFVRIMVSIDPIGNIHVVKGSVGTSLSLASVPHPLNGAWTSGYFVVSTDASNNVNVIEENDVYRFDSIQRVGDTIRLQMKDDVTSDYIVQSYESMIPVDPSISPVNITLPLISEVGRGFTVIISDVSGMASVSGHEITVLPSGTDTILGMSSLEFDSDYESKWFVADGNGKWLLI